MTWPTKASNYKSTKDLFETIREVLTAYGMALIATAVIYFLFSDWFAEPSMPAPTLLITGPVAEASLLLELLVCMVRRGLLMNGIGSHGFPGLIQQCHPTILLDARHFTSRSLQKLLASSGSRVFAPWGASVAEFSFSKVIYLGPALVEDVPTDFALHVHLLPSPRGASLLDEKKRKEMIATLQPQLVAYHLHNLPKVRASNFDLPELDLEARAIGRSLGRPIVDAPDLQASVRSLLEGHAEELRSARWTDPNCVVVEALLDQCHSPQPDGIYVGKVTEAATAILKARGVSIKLSARSVGHSLRQFGFTPKRNGKGSRILLTDKCIRSIHGLARDFRVAAVSINVTTLTELLFIPWWKDRVRNQRRLAEFASQDQTWIQDQRAAAVASEMTRNLPLGKKKRSIRVASRRRGNAMDRTYRVGAAAVIPD